MGYLPTWYLNMRAARYMGVAPWDVENRSVSYRDQALAAESAENAAEEQLRKNARAKKGKR